MHKNFKDLTGQKFGRLVVIKKVNKNKQGKYYWLCQCECGNKKKIMGCNLKSGATKSCGCLQKEMRMKRGHIPWNKGIPMNIKTKNKLSNILKGKKRTKEFKTHLSKISKGNTRALGYKHTEKAKKKISEAQMKEKHHNWKGGITPFRIKIWRSKRYKEWRDSVFK